MDVQPDFKELLALFNAHHVEYMIVGAYALAFHGAPRYTGALDLLVKADPDNAQRILKVLEEFGFGGLDLSVEDFTKKERVVQLGVLRCGWILSRQLQESSGNRPLLIVWPERLGTFLLFSLAGKTFF